MRKFAIWIVAILLCCALPIALAEEGDISYQQLFGKPTPTPAPEQPASATGEEAVQSTPVPDPTATPRLEGDGSVVLTITAVGDVTIGRNVQSSSTIFAKELKRQNEDINFIFRNVKDIFESDDITIVNFEGVLAENYSIPSSKKNNSFLFLAPTAYAQALPDNGVEIATIENNHIDDFGSDGRASTQQALENAGVTWADEYNMAEYETQGVKVAVLSYKTFDYYDTLFSKVPAEIAAAKADHDLVIVAFHWGAEKDYAPNTNQQKLGHAAIDAGADLVIGHHSHRINPIEKYNGKYIVYSLGNFSFAGNNKPDDMSTFIFQTRFRIKNGEIIANPFRIIPCRISSKTDYNDFAPTPYTAELQISNVIKTMQNNSKKLSYPVESYPLDWE